MTTTSNTMQGNDVKWCHVLTSFGIVKKSQRVVPLGMTLYAICIIGLFRFYSLHLYINN